MITIADLLNINLPDVEEAKPHRTSGTPERTPNLVELKAVSTESVRHTKSKKGPTDQLIEVGPALTELPTGIGIGYYIRCEDTGQTWYAPDEETLNANFIFREDLQIELVEDSAAFMALYSKAGALDQLGVYKSKVCRILDNPAAELYEVYYDSAYPMIKYGKATPQGTSIHKYPDRFHRDFAIIELDELYANSSIKLARELTKHSLDADSAIIITDGAYLKNMQASATYYLDNLVVHHSVEGRAPEDDTQAVLLSEINAALMALTMCYVKKKHSISYFYDNTSIINVFRNRKLDYLETVKDYKALIARMDREGFSINFYELHPKSDADKDNLNKALVFFHNRCDAACTDMADVCKKDYANHIQKGPATSTYSKDVKKTIPSKNNYNNKNNSYRR